jgi:Flp pilus assembly pilin Flp
MLKRLCVEDRGQDVIEYALLSAAIGIAGILV